MADVTPPAAGWDMGHVLAIAGGATLFAVAGPAILTGTAIGAAVAGIAGAAGVPIGTGLLTAAGAWVGHKLGQPK